MHVIRRYPHPPTKNEYLVLKTIKVPIEHRTYDGKRLIGCSDCNNTGLLVVGNYKTACRGCGGSGQSIFKEGIPSDWLRNVEVTREYDKEYKFRWVQRKDWATRFETEPEAEVVFKAILDEIRISRDLRFSYNIDEVPE